MLLRITLERITASLFSPYKSYYMTNTYKPAMEKWITSGTGEPEKRR
jgi:hypothetical protein